MKNKKNWKKELKNKYDFIKCYPECSDGWKKLLFDLSKEVWQIIKHDKGCKNFRVVQIKEKFGTLRYYNIGRSSGPYEIITNIIQKYENLSAVTCEKCGKSAKLRDHEGWLMTLCDKCWNAYLFLKGPFTY